MDWCCAIASMPLTTGSQITAEGTFTICSFWLVAALATIGETDTTTLFEKLLSFAGPLLLYGEEIDVTTGQHLGNFPQAFTHLALIDAALRLMAAEGTTPRSLPPRDKVMACRESTPHRLTCTFAAPSAGFEPAAHGLGNRCSIP